MKQLVVLKPNQPMRIANASFKIKQGQVLPHPGYPLAENVFDIFDDTPEGLIQARITAAKNVEMKNIATRHGVTSMKTLAEALKKESKDGPTQDDRKRAFENAKLLTAKGLEESKPSEDDASTVDHESPEEELARLKEENSRLEKELKEKTKKVGLNTESYLDQNTRTAVKRVKDAVKNKKLKKGDVENIIKAEEEGQARIGILGKLKNFIKDDAIFGKLIK